MIVREKVANRLKFGKVALVYRRRRDRPPRLGGPESVRIIQPEHDKQENRLVIRRPLVCHAKVGTVLKGLLHEVSDENAIAAGYEDKDALISYWRERYDEGPGDPELPGYPVPVPIWVVLLEPVESPRFLATGDRIPADPRGYTFAASGSMADQPEALTEDELETYAAENRQDDDLREFHRRQLWEQRTLAERADALERLAPLAGIDVSRELRLMEHALGKAYEKVSRVDRAA